MKTKRLTQGLVGVAGALLLAVPVLFGGGRPTDPPPVDPPSGGDESQCEFLLEETQDELAECQASSVIFPGDGQTGAPLAYEQPDPPDGTFIDLNTGLMWEMKLPEDDPLCLGEEQALRDIHCVQNRYTWTVEKEPPYDPNGTAFTEFLAELKGELGGEPFAGYTDWRLPTVKELQSLVDYSRPNEEEPDVPAVSPDLPGATAEAYYWSSTSYTFSGDGAWGVSFTFGGVRGSDQRLDFQVRAVRGGQ